jgi:adenine-specific DNA-methyltransferase
MIRIPMRLQLCSVYTPLPLADAMIRALGDSSGDQWLEPCVGKGVFLQALASINVPQNRIIAIDLNRKVSIGDSLARTLRGVDFLDWAQATNLKFDKIIANPPFIALNKLNDDLLKATLSVQDLTGKPCKKGLNYWLIFLYSALRLLKANGSLAFVLPSSWEYANYAASARKHLPIYFQSLNIYRSGRPLFDGVQEGCIVIVARGFRPHMGKALPKSKTTRFYYSSPEKLISGLRRIKPRAKNNALADGTPLIGLSKAVCQLREVLQIRLGGVTGDSSFFVLSEEQRRSLQLPISAVCPILSKARHLHGAFITERHWQQLKDNGERVWLFRPDNIALRYRTVASYLRNGGCKRNHFKIKARSVWYQTPLDSHIDGFMSGMGKNGPYVSFFSMPRLNATNTLYTIRFSKRIASREAKAAWALSLLSSHTRNYLKQVGRLYPDGLIKYEPGDLLRAPIIIPKTIKSSICTYRRAVNELVKGNIQGSSAIADSFLSKKC